MIHYNSRNCFSAPLALFSNLLLSLCTFIVCRLAFYLVNQSFFPEIGIHDIWNICKGGFYFDLSALVYINILYIALMSIPFHYKENKRYQQATFFLFILTNSLAIIINLMDTVYFRFTKKRTTASIFNEFSEESNLGSIIGTEISHYWYLSLLAILLIFILFKFYRKSGPLLKPAGYITYYTTQLLLFIAVIPCSVFAIRGGIGSTVRPIAISNANQYVNRPIEASIVLNTPFSIIRTIGKKVYINPHYFPDEKALNHVFTPIHQPRKEHEFKPMNVVIFIMESFGKEYIGVFNKTLEGGSYKGYTPFLDSLINESLTFEYSLANGQASIDGMPSILSGIPKMFESYFVTHYSLNKVSGIAGELRKKGYHTSFFHGAPNGSMGFEAFARTSGYEEYYGLNEYGNKTDFDGTWAIWDEEFFQFYAKKLNGFKQPFVSTLFSASSHHPFKLPTRYIGTYPEEELPIHKCVRYSDHALELFFETASKEPWFDNTLFVITADHTNMSNHPEYTTDRGLFSVPIIFYHPGSNLKGNVPAIAEQIDIMPTVLGYLGYDRPFLSFGRDLLDTPNESGYAINYTNQIFQYFKGNYMLQFDGEKSIALYDFINDVMLKENLLGKIPEQATMETELKAIIQQYIERMLTDRLTVE